MLSNRAVSYSTPIVLLTSLLAPSQSVAGVVESLKIITKAKSLRIAEYAFKLAHESGRKKVTAVHKANIMYVS